MPLSNDKVFGVVPMTEAINKLPKTETIIRESGIFKPKFLKTTAVTIDAKEGHLSLVPAVPRGTPGVPVATKSRAAHTFEMTHLPKKETVLADDVQNVRSFGSENNSQAVVEVVNEKLIDMKSDIEYTREHMMLGALHGKLLNADGSVILDINNRFGIKRKTHNIELSKDTTLVAKAMDSVKVDLRNNLKGETAKGWVTFAGASFYQELIYHKSIYELYKQFQDKILVDGQVYESFTHQNVTYVLYDHEFDSGLKIADDEGIFLPKGTRKSFFEYFAPANMNKTVNTNAKPYYASREELPHGKGWDLEAQSNPLPLITRPDLVFTLKMT